MNRSLPTTASVAHDTDGAKLFAPSAARNADVISRFICEHAPVGGNALEIASGTGQHVTAFARAVPNILWQPSDIDRARLASIDAYVAEAKLSNVSQATYLDATRAGWSVAHMGTDLIVLVNLLHLISEDEARCVISEAAAALGVGGRLIFYGPFKRDGKLISDGDTAFDAQLRASDPAIGYKDIGDIKRWIADAHLASDAFDMPANNLALLARKVET